MSAGGGTSRESSYSDGQPKKDTNAVKISQLFPAVVRRRLQLDTNAVLPYRDAQPARGEDAGVGSICLCAYSWY